MIIQRHRSTLTGRCAFLQFLLPAILGLAGSFIQANQQKKAIRAEREAIQAGERKSQEAQRKALRSGGSGKGTGDFEAPKTGDAAASSFGTQLAQLTGK